jgi:hypothetical protein
MTLASFEPAELGRFTRAFEDFFYQDDPESMTSYYAENAQLMADGTSRSTATGRSAGSGAKPLPALQRLAPAAPSTCTNPTPRASWGTRCAR